MLYGIDGNLGSNRAKFVLHQRLNAGSWKLQDWRKQLNYLNWRALLPLLPTPLHKILCPTAVPFQKKCNKKIHGESADSFTRKAFATSPWILDTHFQFSVMKIDVVDGGLVSELGTIRRPRSDACANAVDRSQTETRTQWNKFALLVLQSRRTRKTHIFTLWLA